MEGFLARYTQTVQPVYSHESRAAMAAAFRWLQNMFLILGRTPSCITGLAGILKFTSAPHRRTAPEAGAGRAVQSIGRTDRPLKCILMCEGVYYTIYLPTDRENRPVRIILTGRFSRLAFSGALSRSS